MIRKYIFKKIKSLVIIFIISLILLEITFRFVPKSIIPNLSPNKLNVEFKEFGPWFTANQKKAFNFKCGFVYPISINKFGMRDTDRDIKKKNNTIRIALLGDSVMQGLHVEDYKYATILMEKKLQNKNHKVEILNFSFSGYGTAQQLSLYSNFVRKFKPDILLLFTLPSNDLRNNSMELEYLSYGKKLENYGTNNAPPFAYYEYENNKLNYYPNLVKNNKLKILIKKYILNNIYIIDFIRNFYKEIKLKKNLNKIELNNKENRKKIKINHNQKNKSIVNSKYIIKEFKKLTKLNNTDFYQIIYNDHNENSLFFEKIAKESDVNYLMFGPKDNNIFKNYLKSKNIQYEETHPICDGHPNEKGHEIISDILSAWLETILKIK